MTWHPLVQKEWKTTRWVMLLFSLVYTLFGITLNNNIRMIKNRYLLNDFVNATFMNEVYRMSALLLPVMLMGITILVILLFSHDRSLSVGKFISSLPFSRTEQLTIKYIMGVISFTLPLILFGGLLTIMRVQNEKWISHLYKYSPYGEMLTKQDQVGALLLWLGIIWTIMLAGYSFLMLIQTLMGQNIIAGIIGAIIYMVPWFLGFAIPINRDLIFKTSWDSNIFESIQFFFLGNPSRNMTQIKTGAQSLGGSWSHYELYEYRQLGVNALILIGIIIISTRLAYYFIQTNDVEKNGELIMYPWVGKVLIAGVTVCAILLLPIILVIFTQIDNQIVALISMAVGGVLGYMISSRSIEMTKKHG